MEPAYPQHHMRPTASTYSEIAIQHNIDGKGCVNTTEDRPGGLAQQSIGMKKIERRAIMLPAQGPL